MAAPFELLLMIECGNDKQQLQSAFDAALTALIFDRPLCIILMLPQGGALDMAALADASKQLTENFQTENLEWIAFQERNQHQLKQLFGKDCLTVHALKQHIAAAKHIINF